MNPFVALLFILLFLLIGELVSTKTKAFVPSMFISAVLFLISFWFFLPHDVLEVVGISKNFINIAIMMLIVHMGTLMSIREILRQWKTIIITVAGVIGICVFLLTIGTLFFGWDTAVVATPPLTGGMVAALMMQEAAAAKGLEHLAVLAIFIYVVQGFAGYPLTAIVLKREGKRLLSKYRAGERPNIHQAGSEKKAGKFRILPSFGKKYETPLMMLFKVVLIAWLGVLFTDLINGVISQFVICLLFGVIAAEIGFIERKPLEKANSFGFIIAILLAYIFTTLANATPVMLMGILLSLAGFVIIGLFGLALFSIFVGRLFGYSKDMAFAIALNAFYGFPANYILTEEAIKGITQDEEEQQYLTQKMLPEMLVGGFTSVTIVSTIIAGLLIHFL